ncbi:MAG: glycosyl transferase, partial [Clostridia bacterium]|nr:glycosyl transferase [Clostridia bacterium]
ETPSLSAIKESVYLHCLRVFKAAKRVGAHGLILMGSCDWNDAFSLVGAKGVGESVFSTMLYIVAAEAILPIIEKNGDTETALSLRDDISRFRENIEKHAFFGDRYARAICDNGKFIGIKGCRECEIDILSQAFAVFAGLDRERAKKALNTAFSELYDRKSRILKLFSPPFTNGEARVGYIRGYVAGIRENGGMYTHGALWGALACLKCGLISEAMLILDAASPALRSADKSLAEKYKNEPYAVSADIYSGEFAGRGGWSWYTGAASWYYRIFFEHVYGLKLGGNTIISARPLAEYEADIALGGAHLHVSASRTHKKALFDNEDAVFPISVEKGEHTLCLPIFD